MVNYNDGKWHGWNGGECPVHPETVVDVVGFPGLCPRDKASIYNWTSMDSPIVAFRVINEHKEPREFWIAFNPKGEAVDYSKHIDDLYSEDGWTCALFREVIE